VNDLTLKVNVAPPETASVRLEPSGHGRIAGTIAPAASGALPESLTVTANRIGEFATRGTIVRRGSASGNGSFELPIGPNKLVLGNSAGWVARAVERWQMNVIYNVTSGNWTDITATTGMYSTFVPDVVNKPWTYTSGDAKWNGAPGNGPGGAGTGGPSVGTYFGQARLFNKINDPQCQLSNHVDSMGWNLMSGNSATNAFANCSLTALTDSQTGTILLQNAPVGTPRGSLGENKIRGNGSWTLDANISKTVRISESKSAQIRVDSTNILNHPQPGTPSLSINSENPFGYIAAKGTQRREFKATVRLSF